MKKRKKAEGFGRIAFEFLAQIDQPFTLDTLLQKTSLPPTRENVRDIVAFLRADDSLVEEPPYFYPKAFFLKDVPIRVQPKEWEINNGIWIPGHRLLPFYPVLMPQDMVSYIFKDTGEEIKSKTIAMKMPDLHVYFSLMDLHKIPFQNAEDLLQKDADLKIKVCQMEEFYLRSGFQVGDTLIVRPLDLLTGRFSVAYDSMASMRAHIFEIQRLDKTFIKTLKEVLKKKLWYPNAEKQLLYTYYDLKQSQFYKWDIPCTALGPLLAENPDIRFSMAHSGRRIFHFSDQTLDDLDIYPDLTVPIEDEEPDELSEADEVEPDMNSIEGVLQITENICGLCVVRALLFEMITNQERFDYARVEDYLFAGVPKPVMSLQLKRHFRALVQAEYRQIKQGFDLKYAFLPITTARQKILEQAALIRQFFLFLQDSQINVDDVPKGDLIHLYELYHGFEEILQELDDAQINRISDISPVHKIVKMVDLVAENLPILFATIREKMEE